VDIWLVVNILQGRSVIGRACRQFCICDNTSCAGVLLTRLWAGLLCLETNGCILILKSLLRRRGNGLLALLDKGRVHAGARAYSNAIDL
jgi:hypothetical protein